MTSSRTKVSRSIVWGIGSTAIAAIATWAITAPLISSQPFDLPMPGQTAPIWNDPMTPPTTRVGVTVKVNPATGPVKVVVPGDPPTSIGQVMPGNTYVVEGYWQQLNVTRLAGHPIGLSEVRGNIDGYAVSDGIVGGGSVTLPPAGGIASPYKSFAPNLAYRLFAVRAAGPDVLSVKATIDSAPIHSIDGGDWSFVGVDAASQLWVAGKGLVEFTVYDMKPGTAPSAGTAWGVLGDVDSVYVDGTRNLIATLSSTSCPLTVTWQRASDPQPTTFSMSPGQCYYFNGMLKRLEWQYGSAGSVSVTVAGS